MSVSPPQNIDDNLPYPSNICSSSSADKVLSEDNKNITLCCEYRLLCARNVG